VTLLNTYEKLKMAHEKQLHLGNIKSKVNEICYVKHVIVRLKCGSGCGTDPRSRCGTDMGIKWGTDIGIKCVILIASFLRCYFFVMD
jgi:hypothetical protein